MKDYLKQQITDCEKRQRATHRDPAAANYWRGKADVCRDILKRLEDEYKPGTPDAFGPDPDAPEEAEEPEEPDNPRNLKVWGIMGYNSEGKQERCVVAAKTKKKAAKALDCTVFHLGKYGAITGNEFEIKVALENPGKVIFTGG